MADSYYIQKGELVLLNRSSARQYQYSHLFRSIKRLGWGIFVLLGTCGITYVVYLHCVSPHAGPDDVMIYSLSDSITTGALFATFGSAIISVFTLSAASHLNLFGENLAVLEQELASSELDSASWKRWSFLPRLSKMSVQGKIRHLGLRNASICFATASGQLWFQLPTTQADFGELPVFRSFLRMKCHRGAYLDYLNCENIIEEYPAWDCLCAMYKNILVYRFSNCCTWIGTCFVLESIVFSFLFPYFQK